MSLFVHITDQCKTDARLHNYDDALGVLVEKLERDQNIALFDAFPPPYLVRKQFGCRQGRLIAARRDVTVEGIAHTIVVLLAILIRGDDAYDNRRKGFGHVPEIYGNLHFEPILKELEPHLAEIVRDRTRKNPPPKKPDLSDSEHCYLAQAVANGDLDSEILVCETKKWISAIANAGDRQLLDIRKGIEALYEAAESGTIPTKGEKKLPNGRVIRYAWDAEKRRILLLTLAEQDNLPETEEAESQIFRTYPGYMTIDEGLFIELEKDAYGNLALSDEEQEVLRPGGESPKFPMFINGRAGSGKSTILQYLFAEFYARRAVCDGPFANPPAYFACNEELIRKAREFVSSILRTNPSYVDNEKIRAALENVRQFQNSFKVFQSHLLSLLTREERISQFPRERYVDYARFLRLWEEKFGQDRAARREFGPDISWHVIRTFIKGASAECEMEKDEFDLLPKNQKNVSSELFVKVYERVWEAWYRDIKDSRGEKALWDDQDLVRFLLAEGRFDSEEAKFPGIFCDEAQDFTQIEIVAFLKMSAFSERQLFPHFLPDLPFVFAGDEFQTLNPTGFSWDAVKGMFHEKFIRGLCPSASHVELVAKDLKNNYRSVGQIVRFSNSVQLLRSVRFGKRFLEPQNEWSVDYGRPISFFERDSDAFWARLETRDDVHLVVPCHANEELDYIRQDPVLKDKVEIDIAKGTTKPSVLSAVRAKGLEYQCVVVYGFGEALPDNTLIDIDEGANWSGDAVRMMMEYFVNRLYVAVSRPRNQLYIVDSQEGLQKLWNFAESQDELEEWAGKSGRESLWTGKTTAWVRGTDEMLNPSYSVNWTMLAEQDERAAETTGDAAQMFKAAEWYMNAGNRAKSAECKGKALRFQGKWLEAGSVFFNNNQIRMAGDCYWEMASETGWKKMCEIAPQDPSLGGETRYLVAKVLVDVILNHDSARTALTNVLTNVSTAVNAADADMYQTVAWRTTLSTLMKFALDCPSADLANVLGRIVELGDSGFPDSAFIAAKKAMEVEQFGLAKRLFEQAKETENSDYHRAVAFTAPYPAKLHSLSKLGAAYDKHVLSTYDSNNSVPINDAQKTIVASAMFRCGRMNEFVNMCATIENDKDIASLSAKIANLRENNSLSAGSAPWLARTLEQLALIAKFRIINAEDLPEAVDMVIKNHALEGAFIVRLLARCRESGRPFDFSSASPAIQRNLFSYLDQAVDKWFEKTEFRSKVSPVELGAALELFGKRISAIAFYEKALQLSDDRYLRERLFAMRLKQLKFHQDQNPHRNTTGDLIKLTSEAKACDITLASISADPMQLEWEELQSDVVNTAHAEFQTKGLDRKEDAGQRKNEAPAPHAPSTDNHAAPPASQPASLITPSSQKPAEPSAPPVDQGKSISGDAQKEMLLRATDFAIDGKYKVEWWPKKRRVRITITDEDSDFNGDAWTLDKAGISGDGEVEASSDLATPVSLPNTPLAVSYSGFLSGWMVANCETGVSYIFPMS